MSEFHKTPENQLRLENYALKTFVTNLLQDYALIEQLFSGNYNDLSNKPNLFSGNYNDLSNKPNLAQYITTTIFNQQHSLVGSTDWFDPSSPTGSIQTYTGDKGIVSSMVYQLTSTDRTTITVNLSQSIEGKFIVAAYHAEEAALAFDTNFAAPMIAYVNPTQIKIGIRQYGGNVDKIRIELLFIQKPINEPT